MKTGKQRKANRRKRTMTHAEFYKFTAKPGGLEEIEKRIIEFEKKYPALSRRINWD